MNEDVILKLISSPVMEDKILALNYLIKFPKNKIIEFFNNNGDDIMTAPESLSKMSFQFKDQHRGWLYFYKGSIGFYVSDRYLQLYNHPNKTYQGWPNEEL